MDVTYMEAIWNRVVYFLNTIPRPIKYWFIPEHEQSARNAKYDENYKCKHAKEAKGTNEPSWEGKLHSHEDSSLYSRVYPAEEPYKAILIR